MPLSTAEDLAQFVAELGSETDRGLALVATALIDDRLLETLRAFFCKGTVAAKLLDEPSSPLGTFSSRTDACFALGLIDEHEYSEIALLRKVRNEFAHAKHGMSFRAPKVQGFCSSLKSPLPEGADYPLTEPRFRFTNATVAIVLRLYHRPEWVAQERRMAKSWVSPEDARWRSVKDEPPPVGVPVMAMAKRRESK